jgi:hypothetical protein
MSFGVSLLLAVLLISLVLFFAEREVVAYRRDQATRADLYPYTSDRLIRRLAVSACLIAEVILLFPLRFALSPVKPLWFLFYVAAVLLLAIVMTVLSLFDLRETIHLRKRSRERLLQEFLHELRRGSRPPETH